ncbi:hypothetical protein F4861DRAFT_544073 [Xylaria intraflava]|nr:hypothetical protein F4861DRAFT_544073 [Xylaria intraflava]
MPSFPHRKSPPSVEFWIVIAAGVLVTIIAALRFLATYRRVRVPGLEDWLALAALLAFYDVNVTVATIIGLIESKGTDVDPEVFAFERKWILVGFYGLFLNYLFTKLSILALYKRVFGVKTAYLAWIYSLAVFEIVWFIAMSILEGLHCRPLNKFWMPETTGFCINESIVIIVLEVPNSLVDFAMVGLVVVMLRPLQVGKADKWKLMVLFGLGASVGILGLIKVGVTYSTAKLYSFTRVAIISFIQAVLSMFCCCLPAYGAILPRPGAFSRLLPKLVGSKKRSVRYSAAGSRVRNTSVRQSGNHPTSETEGWIALSDSPATGDDRAWPLGPHHGDRTPRKTTMGMNDPETEGSMG